MSLRGALVLLERGTVAMLRDRLEPGADAWVDKGSEIGNFGGCSFVSPSQWLLARAPIGSAHNPKPPGAP